jgi:hypothetical protein
VADKNVARQPALVLRGRWPMANNATSALAGTGATLVALGNDHQGYVRTATAKMQAKLGRRHDRGA